MWDARAVLKLVLLDGDVAEAGVLAVLRKVDRSFEPVHQGGFRAVNKDGFYVDVVKQVPKPPWKRGESERIAAGDLTPSALPNSWFAKGFLIFRWMRIRNECFRSRYGRYRRDPGLGYDQEK